jgi:hypothetical protein
MLVGGCLPGSEGGGAKSKGKWTVDVPSNLSGDGSVGDPPSGQDPAAAVPFGVRMDIWAIAVPRGTVSGNEAFWKRVDENAVSPQRYDLLFKNGFRVGVARQEDWDFFKDLLSRYPARHQLNAVTVTDEQSVEVPVRKGVDEETLAYFDGAKPVELRTYQDAENLLQFTFVPAPRRTDAARVAMAPVVRSTRERLEYNENNEERTIKFTKPERLYELNLAVEVPFGKFLVCSPSADLENRANMGRNFLLLDEDSEQKEMVLLISPVKVPVKESRGLGGTVGGTTREAK